MAVYYLITKAAQVFPLLFVLCCLFGSGFALADENRPKIGLVLAGGGAKGVAHVGVIKVLEEANIKADLVVGTSMGSIVGGFYAMGYGAEQLERITRDIDWDGILIDETPRTELTIRRRSDDFDFLTGARLRFKDGRARLPRGAIAGQKLMLELERLTRDADGIKDFDRLPIPYRAVAADIETGEEVVIGSGNLVTAMRASMAVPGVFPPVVLDNRVLVDGGIVNNVPISVARNMGADIVIVSDFKAQPIDRDRLRSAAGIFGQMINVMVDRGTRQQMALLTDRDLVITTDLGDISTASFDRTVETVPLGEAAAREHLDQIAALSSRPLDVEPRDINYEGQAITAIRFEHDTVLDDAVFASRMRTKPGDPVDFAKLDDDMGRIYGLDLFETVTYRLEERDEGTEVVVQAASDPAGKNYLRFGLRLDNNFNGDSTYDFGVSYTVPAINSLNGEWRTEAVFGQTLSLSSDLYQPIDPAARFFIQPKVFIGERTEYLYADQERIAETRITEADLGFRLGYNFDDALTIAGEITRGVGSVSQKLGSVPIDESGFDRAVVGGGVVYDTLDSAKFPKSGTLALASYSFSSEALGASDQYQATSLSANKAFSWGRHAILASQYVGTSWDGDPGVQDLFQLGGPFRLSGLSSNSLSGTQAWLSRIIYYNELERFGPSFIDVPLYGGFSLEYGDTFDDRDDFEIGDMRVGGSLFLGADTFLGPIYLGAAATEGGEQAVFLSIGDIF
jgi:NTE family protein